MFDFKSDQMDIRKVAESGQCFRLRRLDEARWRLVAGNRLLLITERGAGRYRLDCDARIFDSYWRSYFDLDQNYGLYTAAVPRRDHFLNAAVCYGRGITILRQDSWEMLITFLISQRKSIPAIKTAVERLCTAFGEPIAGTGEFAFPQPAVLARQTPETLAGCSLGYRTPYVLAAARAVDSGALDLETLRSADTEMLRRSLLLQSGVGDKVANCVMLFGFHRLEAFPRDVWMNRVIDAEYGGKFPLRRYRGFEGVIQQYMFYYARSLEYAAVKQKDKRRLR
ncbi:MAG: DNA-3-methyladenine glycosylase 2 family protein [Intestinimonas sp.]|jgi:N-glycosylase/DNA lyase|nr:DNA-3-methyladenine glycosylase 2 family protein [Intestinimonas sp.]